MTKPVVHALLPLKDLVDAKSRLSGILRSAERRALAQAMVEDVLSVLARHADIASVTLVSDDPGAHLLADSYGAQYQPESELGCRGLNPVITCCSETLKAAGARRMLVLHGDLPLLAATDISSILSRQRQQGGVVVGTDLAGRGTNMLAFDTANTPDFSFGADSCAHHVGWARAAGVPVSVLQKPGIGLDIDEVADLQRLLACSDLCSSGRTAALLRQWPGSRMQAVLASLDPSHPDLGRSISRQ